MEAMIFLQSALAASRKPPVTFPSLEIDVTITLGDVAMLDGDVNSAGVLREVAIWMDGTSTGRGGGRGGGNAMTRI